MKRQARCEGDFGPEARLGAGDGRRHSRLSARSRTRTLCGSMSERVRAHIRGKVQGVGYRASTAAMARELGLRGWVRNRNDGGVELCAEGERTQLDALVEWCRKGPAFARVDAIDLQWAAAQGDFAGFEIRR